MNYVPHAGYALFLWWFSTGLVLYLNGLSPDTFRRSLIGAPVVLVLALAGLFWSSGQTTITAAYVSFTCGLLVYAWQELSYYMGFVTGPRNTACGPGCSGWSHFVHAIQTNLYHEVATILGAALVILLSWDAPNQVGMWTYLVLWGMQLSAKLNVFLGVRNLNEEFLPAHMQHLKSFLKKRPMNLLFPFSITAGTAITVWLGQLALVEESLTFTTVGCTFLAALMALAVLEHWLLVLPLPAAAPWQWWLDLRDKSGKRESGIVAGTPRRRNRASRPVPARSLRMAVEEGDSIASNGGLVRGRDQ